MSDPEGASATEEARKACEELGDPSEPIVQVLTADLEQLAARLQQANADRGESGPS